MQRLAQILCREKTTMQLHFLIVDDTVTVKIWKIKKVDIATD